MKCLLIPAVAGMVLTIAGWANSAAALEPCACRRTSYPWHGNYYHTGWGIPVALVVPPHVEYQTHWGWGVGNTRVTPICHQYHRHWPGPGSYDRKMFKPTPPWPSDTDQFGVYYVRGPW